jgi:hypothetical protein
MCFISWLRSFARWLVRGFGGDQMSGVLTAMVGMTNATPFALQVVDQGGSSYGGGPSANVPSTLTPSTFKGQSILAFSSSSSVHLSLIVSGAQPQGLFRELRVQTSAGGILLFRASDAQFSTPLNSIWSWGNSLGIGQAWNAASGNRQIDFIY